MSGEPVSAHRTEPFTLPFRAFSGIEGRERRPCCWSLTGGEGSGEEERAAAAAPPGLFPPEKLA